MATTAITTHHRKVTAIWLGMLRRACQWFIVPIPKQAQGREPGSHLEHQQAP